MTSWDHAAKTTEKRIGLYFSERNRLEGAFAALLVPTVIALVGAAFVEGHSAHILGPIIAFTVMFLLLTFRDLMNVERRLSQARSVEKSLFKRMPPDVTEAIEGDITTTYEAMETKVDTPIYLSSLCKLTTSLLFSAFVFGCILVWR